MFSRVDVQLPRAVYLFGGVYPRVCLSILFYQVTLNVCRTLFPAPLVLCTRFFVSLCFVVCRCECFPISRVSLYYCVSLCFFSMLRQVSFCMYMLMCFGVSAVCVPLCI